MADPISTDPLERFEAAVRVRVGGEAEDWLAQVAELISSVTAAWDLHVTAVANRIDAFGMSIPARRDSERVTLRIAYPDPFLADETAALRAWNGTGAVRILEEDERGAQLRTSPVPGTAVSLERNEMKALRMVAETLRALWIEPPARRDADARRRGPRVGRNDAGAVRVGASAVRRAADARRGGDVPFVRTEPDGRGAPAWRRPARHVPA